MTYEMICKMLMERRFDDLYLEGMLDAWAITFAHHNGWMTDDEVKMYSEMLLNV